MTLLDAEGNIEGATSEPLVSQLPVLGRGQRSGRAETRHGHVHALACARKRENGIGRRMSKFGFQTVYDAP